MNILLVNDGTSGDLLPFFALGRELVRRGHQVTACTNDIYQKQAERLGFLFVSTGTVEEYEASTSNPEMWSSSKARVTAWKEIVVPRLRPQFDLLSGLLEGETLIICGLLTAAFARAVQELHGVPLLTVVLSPQVFMSARRPAKGLPIPTWLPYPARAAMLRGLDYAIDSVMAPDLNRFRADLGLAPIKRVRGQKVYSPDGTLSLFPAWYAEPQSDWPRPLSMTGFTMFDEGRNELDQRLQTFLDHGDAPLVFTAGTGMRHGHAFFAAAVELLGRLGRRGILLSKTAEQVPAQLPPEVIHVEFAPMRTLLPRSAALIHHGGIGTTAEALAAGIPQLIVPYAYDQFDNADRIRHLGCGLSLPDLTELDAAEQALRQLLTAASVRQACARYQTAMEPGPVATARAADVVETLGRQRYGHPIAA